MKEKEVQPIGGIVKKGQIEGFIETNLYKNMEQYVLIVDVRLLLRNY
ncbi:MAG: hypothetical protein ACI4S2_04455 [Lachnospiraceae bacterium]